MSRLFTVDRQYNEVAAKYYKSSLLLQSET